jgi:hypothetical protein
MVLEYGPPRPFFTSLQFYSLDRLRLDKNHPLGKPFHLSPPKWFALSLHHFLTALKRETIHFPLFIQIPKYGAYEDAIMFVSGFYSLILLLIYWKVEHQRGYR